MAQNGVNNTQHCLDTSCEYPIRFCPHCGEKSLQPKGLHQFVCSHCDFTYFHNPASTADVIIAVDDEILLVERGRDPKKGYYDLPGGFTDLGETAEACVVREIQEELHYSIAADQLEFVCTAANHYPYKGIAYHTVDVIFALFLDKKPHFVVGDDVADLAWFKRDAIPFERLCFSSMVTGIDTFLTKFN